MVYRYTAKLNIHSHSFYIACLFVCLFFCMKMRSFGEKWVKHTEYLGCVLLSCVDYSQPGKKKSGASAPSQPFTTLGHGQVDCHMAGILGSKMRRPETGPHRLEHEIKLSVSFWGICPSPLGSIRGWVNTHCLQIMGRSRRRCRREG